MILRNVQNTSMLSFFMLLCALLFSPSEGKGGITPSSKHCSKWSCMHGCAFGACFTPNTAKGWIVHTIIFPQKRFIQREFIWEALTWMISAAKPMTYICGENPVDRILIHDLLLIGSTWCKLGYHFKLSHNNSTSY